VLFLGVALLGDAILTVAWQDPFTAVFTQRDQKALGRKLAAAEATPLPPATLAHMKRLARQEQMSMLAGRLDRRTAPGDPLGRISIPRINSSFVFVAGTGTGSLKKGPGHYSQTLLPGQHGTV